MAQQTPKFRTRTDVVQFDVSVLDKNRQPVRGLTEKDFAILEDGKAQPIVGFSTFDIDTAPAPTVGWMRDIPPDVTTNLMKESRLFVIVLDDGMIPQQPGFARDATKIANSIIDKLGPDDQTAVVFTADNRKTQDFTNDKTKLRASLERFNPGFAGYRFGLDSQGVDVDLYFQQSSVRTLGSIAEFLIEAPNRRKGVFYISPGVPMDLTGAVPNDRDGSPVVNPADTRESSRLICATGTCPPGDPRNVFIQRLPPANMTDLAQRTQDIFRRAQLANVTVYPIDPTGLDGMRTYLSAQLGPTNLGVSSVKATAQQDYLAAAAANTGGRTVMNTNDFEPGIGDIFNENASYYLIAFAPTNTKADGTLRRIQVKVDRPDVEVRTRSRYYAPEPEETGKKNAKNTATPEVTELANAIGGLLPSAGLPMKVAVAPFALPGQRVSTVAIVLGVRQPVPAGAAKARVHETTELQISAFTAEGDPRGMQRQTATVVLRAGTDGEVAYEVLGRIDLPAGRYRLRLAAHNATSGRTGSVFTDVIVPDFSNAPFSASQILLRTAPGLAAAPVELLADLLPFVPTAERAFGKAEHVTALVRLYQDGKNSSEPVHVTMRIRDAQDQVKVTATQAIQADQFPLARGQFLTDTPTFGVKESTPEQFLPFTLRAADVIVEIPFSRLSAGPHLLTFEATIGTTTVRRDVRFEVR